MFRKNNSCSKGFNTHLWGSQGDRWENVHFLGNLGMWPLKSIVLENWVLFWWFQHTFMGFLRSEMENVCFQSKPWHVTPQINHLRKLSHVLRISTHICGVSKEKDGKNVHFLSKPRHVTTQINCLGKLRPFLRVSTHINGGFKEIDGKTVHFESKPRHVTPQINCLRKLRLVLRFSTHIYGVLKEWDGKIFIFWVNLGMWPFKLIISDKWALFWGFQHTVMGFAKEWDGKCFFQSKPRHVTPQIDHLGKLSPVLRVSTHIDGASKKIDQNPCIFRVNLGMWPIKSDHIRKTSHVLKVSTDIYGVSKKIDEKTCIFRVNLGMWPLKSIISEKQAMFCGFQHIFIGIPRR